MISFDDLYNYGPFELGSKEKTPVFFKILTELNDFHVNNCPKYKKFFRAFFSGTKPSKIENFPFLPVTTFKKHKLITGNESNIIKVLRSSGTTDQQPSNIYLDKETSDRQAKVLAAIVKQFIGDQRLPMIIVDTKDVFKNKTSFSARGAGILGFSTFGKDHLFLLDENMNVNVEGLQKFIERHKDEKILIFGFTYIVWQYLYKYFLENKIKINLENGILVHSGGWKKMIEEKVDNDTFKKSLKELLGIKKVHNFYGMAEQVGSVYMECEEGFFHTSIFSDILIRDYKDWSVCKNGTQGIIETISLIPRSYPGHVLLTEDLGTIMGEDNCKCGRKGKYFKVSGRIPKAELRGCSDTTTV